MNVKNFIIGGIVGGIVNFLLGWIIYGMLLKDFFPIPEGSSENLAFIGYGSLAFGFLLSFVLAQGETVTKCVPGVKLAAFIGLFVALYFNFFQNMYSDTIDVKLLLIDTLASMVIAAFMGASIAVVNGKMK
jgi:hypothetical protein